MGITQSGGCHEHVACAVPVMACGPLIHGTLVTGWLESSVASMGASDEGGSGGYAWCRHGIEQVADVECEPMLECMATAVAADVDVAWLLQRRPRRDVSIGRQESRD